MPLAHSWHYSHFTGEEAALLQNSETSNHTVIGLKVISPRRRRHGPEMLSDLLKIKQQIQGEG